nr:MAG TPA: Cell Wall Hydrolase [Caudoviricetes sp.]
MNNRVIITIAIIGFFATCVFNIITCSVDAEAERKQPSPMPTKTPVVIAYNKPVATPVKKIKATPALANIKYQETDKFKPEYLADGSVNYFGWSHEDFKFLSECISGEAQGCSWKHMLYVGSVVLNRKYHAEFPNTIKDVCLDPGQYACFVNGVCYTEATEKCKAAAYELLKYGSLLPKNVIFQAQFEQGDGVYQKIGNTYFCYINR